MNTQSKSQQDHPQRSDTDAHYMNVLRAKTIPYPQAHQNLSCPVGYRGTMRQALSSSAEKSYNVAREGPIPSPLVIIPPKVEYLVAARRASWKGLILGAVGRP
jgi:hypothetical protein